MSDYLSLSTEEKIDIVKATIKSVQYLKFQILLKIEQEQELPADRQRDLEAYQEEYNDAVAKEQSLINKLAELEAQIV